MNPIQGEGARLLMSSFDLLAAYACCLIILLGVSIVVVCFGTNWLANAFILIFVINDDFKLYHCYLLLGLIGTNIDLLFSDFGL